MAPTRFASTLAVLLLGSTALCGSAQAGWFDLGSKSESAAPESKSAVVKSDVVKPAETLDGSIQQARVLRQTGNHQEAIRHLSQLMIVASDDSRVVSEYGKALVETGRAQEGVNFLTRAEQLQPTDWTVFSALGVAYDQLGNHKDAQTAYERALVLQPEEASVLNNYALSRMLAKDPEAARILIARAESAGGKSDSKIARNIAMIRGMAIAPTTQDVATAEPLAAPIAAPKPASVASLTLPPPAAQANPAPEAKPAPAPAAPVSTAAQPSQPVAAAPLVPSGVVMQRVPVDPLAGPVAATRPPRPLVANPVATPVTQPATPALKPAVPVKAPEAKAPAIQAKPVVAKAVQPEPTVKTAPVKTAETKPAPVPATNAKAVAVKTAETKFAPAIDTKPILVKAVAKDETRKTAAAAKPVKDAVPSLRMSANAF